MEDEDLQDVKNSRFTKEQVSGLLGNPTDTGAPLFSNDTWYYMGEVVQHRSFLTPKLIDRRVVAIKFKDNVVSNVTVLGKDSAKSVVPVRRHTRTSGDEGNTLKEIFGNIGRIHKGNMQAHK